MITTALVVLGLGASVWVAHRVGEFMREVDRKHEEMVDREREREFYLNLYHCEDSEEDLREMEEGRWD